MPVSQTIVAGVRAPGATVRWSGLLNIVPVGQRSISIV
jgi:hypothetical protein